MCFCTSSFLSSMLYGFFLLVNALRLPDAKYSKMLSSSTADTPAAKACFVPLSRYKPTTKKAPGINPMNLAILSMLHLLVVLPGQSEQ
jgi:hypothetical protein